MLNNKRVKKARLNNENMYEGIYENASIDKAKNKKEMSYDIAYFKYLYVDIPNTEEFRVGNFYTSIMSVCK